MTEQEFDNIEWQPIAHFTGGGKCETGYRPKGDTETTLRKWVIAKYDIHGVTPFQGKSRDRIEYEYKDKTYKSKQKLLEAINNENRGTSTEHRADETSARIGC